MPERIQISRQRGWRKPALAVVVSRPSPWGNPFIVGQPGVPDRAAAVALYRSAIVLATYGEALLTADPPSLFICQMGEILPGPVPTLRQIRRRLRHCDLACWCPLHHPCHADVLLELANG